MGNRKILKDMGKYENIERYDEIENYWKLWENIKILKLKDMGK